MEPTVLADSAGGSATTACSYGGHGATGYAPEYLQATLVVDVVDARTNQLIWRGWANKSLGHEPEPEPKRIQKYASEAVEKILAKFPRESAVVAPLVTPGG